MKEFMGLDGPFNFFTDTSSYFSSILDSSGNYIAGDPISFSPSLNTTYYINDITDINGCSNIATGSELIIVNPLPTATISGATTICAGDNAPLSFALTGKTPFLLNYTDGTSNFNVVLDSLGNNDTSGIPISHYNIGINTVFTLIDIVDNNFCSNL